MAEPVVLIDEPAEGVRRVTMNRPEKRNALNHALRGAIIGYPAVRFGVPDMQTHAWLVGMRAAMEMMLTGDSVSGVEAVRLGWANRSFAADELDERVIEVAHRISLVPADLVQLNKRVV